jgi:hypothetical protein
MKTKLKPLLTLFILIAHFAVCGQKTNTHTVIAQKSITNTVCDSIVFNKEFSQMPFGKSRFSKTYLLDTLFPNLRREECVIYDKDSEETYSITFYSGKASYFTFHKQYQRDEYFLYVFDLQDEVIQLSLNKETKYGIGFTKDYLSNVLSCSKNLCDKVLITHEEGNADVVIYFQNNSATQIIYRTSL